MSGEETDASAPAWLLVQLAELIRRSEQLHLEALSILGRDTGADMPEHANETVAADALAHLVATVADATDLAEQMNALAQQLPGTDVAVDLDEVQPAAAADLRRGVLDAERAIVAARVLDVVGGWPALAETLRTVDVRTSWGERRPRELLATFRGADERLVERVLRRAQIPPEDDFAICSPDELARLAAALDEVGHDRGPV